MSVQLEGLSETELKELVCLLLLFFPNNMIFCGMHYTCFHPLYTCERAPLARATRITNVSGTILYLFTFHTF